MSHDVRGVGGDDDQLNSARLMDACRTVSSVSNEMISMWKTSPGIRRISEFGDIDEFLD